MKKKFLSVLLILVLACSFSLVTAVPVAAQETLEVVPFELAIGEYDGEGDVDCLSEWSALEGEIAVHLDTGPMEDPPGETWGTDGDEARIVIPMPAGTTLGDIESIAWSVYTVAGYPPHVDIYLDVDGDTVVDPEDVLTVEMHGTNNADPVFEFMDMIAKVNHGTWLETFELTSDDGYGAVNDTSEVWLSKFGGGPGDAPSSMLGNWKLGLVDGDPESEITPGVINATAPVLRLEIEVDNWMIESEAYVDDIAINGEVYFGSIQDAIDSANPAGGDTISVAAGEYDEVGQIVIDKDLTIVGADRVTTIIKPTGDTGSADDARGWFLVNIGIEFHLSNVTLDGAGYLIYQAIRHRGFGSIENVDFKEIRYNESGPTYAGLAVVAFGTGPVDISNCTFSGIGRVGVLYFALGGVSTFSGNVYTGKGDGDWLDYALDISAGTDVDVIGNTISDCRGVASVDGSTSAGILVTTYYDPSTQATITSNDIYNNTEGIAVGYDESDTSVVVAHYNNIAGNTLHGIGSTAPPVDATKNWWGDAVTTTTAIEDLISGAVDYSPWLVTSPITGTAPSIVASGHPWTWYTDDSIQDAIVAADSGDIISVTAGTYNENVDILTEDLTLEGAQVGVDPTVEGARAVPAEESTIQGSGGTVVTIDADVVVIDGFTITNPSGKCGITATDHSNITITNNIVTGVGTTDISTSGTNQGIAILSSVSAMDGITAITIVGNRISSIAGGLNKSADGIVIGHSNGNQNITGLLIQNNVISNITSATVSWAEKGRGAYGIKLSHGRAPAIGKTVDAQVLDNTIRDLEGLWAHGIGLEGNTPGAVVERNDISHLIDHKWYLEDIPDAVAVQVEDNPSADTVGIHFNNFSDVLLGVWNKTGDTNVPNPPVDATNNWWGHASGPSGAQEVLGYDIGYGAGVIEANVSFEPWLLEQVVPGELLPKTYDKTLALKDGWTLISTDKLVATTGSTWVGTENLGAEKTVLAYQYTGAAYPQVDLPGGLKPIDALYVKTAGGGGVGINYSDSAPGVSSKDLVAGWNLISSGTIAKADAVLSPLRDIATEGTGLTTVVSQGSYNQYTEARYIDATDWLDLSWKMSPFDGYWIYMNAAKSFGVPSN